ncbi:MAG TPA: type 4a pilus biogenesis protein PilO, partial [Smithellaceae bacterium]|nr:type 4a pilus biogenesis protein PilO [Smithellaceae bacterium]
EVAALKDNYKTALEKLPDQREIPGLLLSIAQAGKDAGVEFVFFEPKAPVPKVMPGQEKPAPNKETKPAPGAKAEVKKTAAPAAEPFYEEMPVSLSVFGNFQNIVSFFEKVAKLPRIVNVSDVIISDRKEVTGRGYVISATCLIKTYMFIDKKEKTSEKTK